MPTTRFLFWNLNRKPLAGLIAELAEDHSVDILMLAECSIGAGDMLRALNPEAGEFHATESLCPAIHVFTRFSGMFLNPVFESERVSIRRVTLPARAELLPVVAHLPSKLHQSSDSQSFECVDLARRIIAAEDRAGHRRTVLVGDFNMNPFETGMVAAEGLHAVMSRQIASGLARTVQGRDYHFFYNPMWGHLGDSRSHTAGSYFFDSAQQVNYFWNMFDQVLLRPELAERFDSSQLRILTTAGNRSLVRRDGRPDNSTGSDHLPIFFELEF